MTPAQAAPAVSLLWPPVPPGAPRGGPTMRLDDAAMADLDVAGLVSGAPRRAESTLRAILSAPPIDPDVIAYRQEVTADLLASPALVAEFEALLPRLVELGRLSAPDAHGKTRLHDVIWRLGQLEILVDCVRALEEALSHPGLPLQSRGLIALRDRVSALAASPTFARLATELPRLRAEAERISSVTIGVNLDYMLRPVGATILSVNSERFTEQSLLARLMGRLDPEHGIGPLHLVPDSVPGLSDRPQPLLQPLFRDLSDILSSTARTIGDTLGRYAGIEGGFLADLEPEIAFYLSAVRLATRLQAAGLPVCRPRLAPADRRTTRIIGLYNPLLALRCIEEAARRDGCAVSVVRNDAALGPEGRVLILTGPNSGGKTTYTQAVGLAHVMAQAGMPVAAEEATISPVDGIHTHFPVAERLELATGRLGEEAARLAAIFERATERSLVLLNESLASTSPGESLYLARDVVRALRLLGARTVYATHLHELASGLGAINAQVPGDSPVVSLVAEVEPADDGDEGVRPTYRIAPGPPLGTSYARQIASRYGISYDKLAASLAARRALPRDPSPEADHA